MKAKVVSLEELKQMCEQFLEVCISGSDGMITTIFWTIVPLQ